jgi:hypothetical protein
MDGRPVSTYPSAVAAGGAGDPWEDAARWSRGSVRREVAFVRSGPFLVYRSIYATAGGPRFGVILCPSWGHEFGVSLDVLHLLARRIARRRGTAAVVHPPGHGDSSGTIAEATVASIVRSVVDVMSACREVNPSIRWAFCGIRFGASTAALARADADSGAKLVVIEPALDPSAYFDDSATLARRLALTGGYRTTGDGTAADTVLGNRLDPELRSSAADVDVRTALEISSGPLVAIALSSGPGHMPPVEPGLERARRITVPGRWSLKPSIRDRRRLSAAALRGLLGPD